MIVTRFESSIAPLTGRMIVYHNPVLDWKYSMRLKIDEHGALQSYSSGAANEG